MESLFCCRRKKVYPRATVSCGQQVSTFSWSRCFVEDTRSLCELSIRRLEGNYILRPASSLTRYSFTSRILCTNQSFVYPLPTCIAHKIALLLHDCSAMHEPPPDPLLYAIYHTILATAISCKGDKEHLLMESLLCRAQQVTTLPAALEALRGQLYPAASK